MKQRAWLALVAAVAILVVLFVGGPAQAPPQPKSAAASQRASAVFAGGCFWCTESDFDHMPGVISTISGYAGGRTRNPTYEQVSAGNTGHIEVVRVVYDPRRISYAQLVERFFRTIDPTDGGGQFCDRGDQYRSAIFVANPAERRVAERASTRASQRLRTNIATAILPAARFWPAEAYHQDYSRRNPVRYRFYRWNCGREARLRQLWGSR